MTKLYVLVDADNLPVRRSDRTMKDQIVASSDAAVVFSVLDKFKNSASSEEAIELSKSCRVAVGEFLIETIL